MKRIRSVLFATDLSNASNAAFAAAIALAGRYRASLTVLHVISPLIPLVPEQTLAVGAWRDIENETRVWATRRIAKLVERARRVGVQAVGRIVDGEPATQIVRAARASKTGVLVIGTHGRTGVSRLLLGSVAQRVVGAASCPVLTVRSRSTGSSSNRRG
ncbi:MAG TPA: universal stress protein [Vicinamibacterales bacterium]|nr:universal stress protein [Vicinamibacterales bacterium]